MFPKYLMSLKFITEFVLSILAVYIVFQFHIKAAFILAMSLALLPALVKLAYMIFDKSNRKSLNMQMMASLNVVFVSLNYLFIAPFKHFNEPDNINGYLFYIICYLVMFPFLRHNLNVFLKIQSVYKSRYRLMLS